MKKYIVTIVAAFLLVTAGNAMSQNSPVSRIVLTAFSAQFDKASDISWKITGNFIKASFQVNGQYMDAFYSTDGILIAISRNIVSSELPIQLQLGITKNYPGSWITELFEYASNGTSTYYLTMENKDEKFILESDSGNEWHLFKKTVK